ncbi:MAG: efflux RND transporter periplasmic adaptor subunit [Bryobacteraceae bacterium]|nr:efflux RND transporter periplasmic adaptor subunit [Bryobacteraceae bacterium]
MKHCGLIIAASAWLFCSGCLRNETHGAGGATAHAAEQPSNDREVWLAPGSPQLERIKVKTAEAASLPQEEVTAPGKIQAIPTRISRVAVPVAGRIRRVTVGLGDSVRAGQVLFTLESPEAASSVSAYRQAEARAGQAKAALAKAEADLSRVRDLFEHRAIAQKEVISAEAALAQAKAEWEQASAAIHESLGRLNILGLTPGEFQQEIEVRAPVSGKILDISVAPGEYRNDTSVPVITIADLATVYIVADVPESLIRLITTGERIEVHLAAFPGEVFSGRVARIADVVNPATRTIQVIAEMPNPQGRLRPEMFGEIRHEETFKFMPVVPGSAIVEREGYSVVWREKGRGHFEAVRITTGKPRGEVVPVLSGIQAGDRIVVDGTMLLERGN